MSRPAKYPDPRNRILAKARALVVRRGFDKVSLRAIAKASGFSPASLYEYFPSKEALFGELAARANRALYQALAQAADGREPRQGLAAAARAYVDFARSHEEDFSLLFRRSVSKRRGLSDEVPEGSAYKVVIELIEQGVEDGDLAADALGGCESCAYAFWALVHGQATLQLTTLRNFDADFEAVDAAAVEALLTVFAG